MGRNENLNRAKAVMAFLVVGIHCKFPGHLGEAVTAVARMGVPFFFLIAGYYVVSEKPQFKRKILHLIGIAIFMELTYMCATVYTCTLADLAVTYLSPKNLALALLGIYGKCGGGWFIYSLIESYLIWWAICKAKCEVIAYFYCAIGLISHIYLQYSYNFRYDIWTSNVLLTAMPFFIIGVVIYQYKERIEKVLNNKMLWTGVFLGGGYCQ